VESKGLIFRIDDVTGNTDKNALKKMIKILKNNFVCKVWACVTPFSQYAHEGSVYPNPPFKSMDRKNFYKVRHFLDTSRFNVGADEHVSHGLIHLDHSSLQYDAQEMSIATSCNILDSDIFVPPFNRWNATTEAVCNHNNIQLVKSQEEGWRCLEFEDFDLSKSQRWYFHPWRFTPESFEKALSLRKEWAA
jgi:hypothetical protein